MKSSFVLMLLVALGQLSFTQQGPAQQQHSPSGVSTAPASGAVAQAEHLILWGITVGAPAPAWPECTGKDGSATENDPACLQAILGSAPEQVQRLGNLLGYATASTAVSIRAGAVHRIQIQMSNDETCRQVVPSLTKKLGEPAHRTLPVQNGSGARWDADIYVWHTADGSEARLNVHTKIQEGMHLACTLEARSAPAIARDDVGNEIMELLVKRETTLADALDALTMVLINALRANYGYRDEFSRFSEQVSNFLEPMERDRTVGWIPLPGILSKTQPKTVTKVEDRPKRLERLAIEVSEIMAKRGPSVAEGFDGLSSTMVTAIEATCGRKRADEFDFRMARLAKEVMSLSQDNDNKGTPHNN